MIVDQQKEFIDHFLCEDIEIKAELAAPQPLPINLYNDA